ncbi:GNAT family N-acetyltransferase [Pedococcus aerophilus]|uniref:GNAT family N-acetyltransferase n=1 Tax=Pedococcus aerophilus TaxID=436356 RepID=A0ABP6HBX1_9MICO
MPNQPRRSASAGLIRLLTPDDLQAVVDLSLSAWEPVFVSFENILGTAIFGHLYRPDWREAQAAEVRKKCLAETCESFVLTTADGGVVGFLVLAQDSNQSLGIIEMVAVHPTHQRRGHASALMRFAIQRLRDRGLALINVGTGGDQGHAPARALYESLGFIGVPLVNYYIANE